MLTTDRPEPAVDDGVVLEAKPASVALVPVIPSAQWSKGPGQPWSPNSIFVTQLIATADGAPQTRGLWRATLADARTAYNASRSQAGSRTRQII
jgi:hypothetical protein